MPAVPPMLASPDFLHSMLTDPRATPEQRAAAAGLLGAGKGGMGGMGGGGGMPAASAGSTDTGFDAAAEIGKGVSAAGGMPSSGGSGGAGRQRGGGTGAGGWNDDFMSAIRDQVNGKDEDFTPQDKGLALARMGFGMAATPSAHFGVQLGAGALMGLQGLDEIRKQRAVESMKRMALLQSGQQHVDALANAKAIADQTSVDRQAAIAQRGSAAKNEVARQREADANRASEANARLTQAQANADALAEQRYAMDAAKRDNDFHITGRFRALAGDAAHGITGPSPAGEDTQAPVIEDLRVPEKQRQALISAHPKNWAAVDVMATDANKAINTVDTLLAHPGLDASIGAQGAVERHIPLFANAVKDFESQKAGLVAQIKTGVMAQMKSLSSSGTTGFGRITNTEFNTMSDKVANLENASDADQLRERLNDVKDYMKQIGGMARDSYVMTYGNKPMQGKGVPVLPWETRDAAATALATPDAETSAVVTPPTGNGAAPSPAMTFKTTADVKSAYDAGKLTYAQAAKILQTQFGVK